MYKVKFNTKDFTMKRGKNWEVQLKNDFAKSINNKEFICETDLDLSNRLAFIAGNFFDDFIEFHDDKNNFFELSNEVYGHQILKYGMYGSALGYVSFDKVLEKVKEKGFHRIAFKDFYDIRQGNFFAKCFVEITKID